MDGLCVRNTSPARLEIGIYGFLGRKKPASLSVDITVNKISADHTIPPLFFAVKNISPICYLSLS
jgi:hypothetical protein